MTDLIHVAALLASAASSASLGFGIIIAQTLPTGDVGANLAAGASYSAAIGLVVWVWKINRQWKEITDADIQKLRAQLVIAEEKAEANHRKYETERRLRLELEEAGIKDRRKYPPPEGVTF